MSVWNAILQASHSALIDTLNEAYPQDKLELGLPKRFDAWGTTEGSEHHLLKEVQTGNETGFLALATRAKDETAATEIFKQMTVLLEKEFKIRKIDATLGKSLKDPPPLRMLIWLPIRIVGKPTPKIFDLGVGI